jgi:hypothetical protein
VDRLDLAIVAAVTSLAFSVWPDERKTEPECKCPDLQSFYADAMAQRDQERAARRLPQDRPTTIKPARMKPDSDDE